MKVANIIAGQGLGYKGVIPGEKILFIDYGDKVSDIKYLVEAIKIAIQNKPDVINISVGTNKDYEELHKIIQEADDQGIVIVAAAGNTGSEFCEYPAAYNEVIGVGACDNREKISNFSIISDKIDVYASGYRVKTISNNSLVEFTGTSASTPFVSSLVAILKGINPSLDVNELKKILEKSSDKLTFNGKVYKIINYTNAIKLTIERSPFMKKINVLLAFLLLILFFTGCSHINSNSNYYTTLEMKIINYIIENEDLIETIDQFNIESKTETPEGYLVQVSLLSQNQQYIGLMQVTREEKITYGAASIVDKDTAFDIHFLSSYIRDKNLEKPYLFFSGIINDNNIKEIKIYFSDKSLANLVFNENQKFYCYSKLDTTAVIDQIIAFDNEGKELYVYPPYPPASKINVNT